MAAQPAASADLASWVAGPTHEQSAMRLGSYVNIADQFDRVFDGFFLTVHWGTCSNPADQDLASSFAPAGDGLVAEGVRSTTAVGSQCLYSTARAR
jgi:hypothetical protein